MINNNVAFPLLSYTRLSSLLSHCARENHLHLGSSIHAAIVKNFIRFGLRAALAAHPRNLLVVWNSLITMYSKCGRLQDASKVFDDMPLRDAISWNSMISGCLARDRRPEGFHYFKRLMFLSEKKTCAYDRATLTTVMSVCAHPDHLPACAMLHSLIISSGYAAAAQVGNALITAYFRCGHPLSAGMVFDGMAERNVIAWTAMVSGLAQSRLFRESLLLFRDMVRAEEEPNSVTYASSLLACSGMPTVWEGQQIHGCVEKSGFWGAHVESAVMDLYSKRGMIEDALQVFYSCVDPDEVILTVMLVGFAQNGTEERAFQMFAEMVGRGVHIDENMVSAVLGAFGRASEPFGLALGKQIHSLALKKCFFRNTFVCNGLVNMYSKCGELKDSIDLFHLTQYKNPVSWNSAIAALGRHGRAWEALQLYQQMLTDGFEPTDVTFVSLLHACGHAGYVEEGMQLLRSMKPCHGIIPGAEHYACAVDMLGRAGRLDEARSFIEGLQVESGDLLWQALLGSCGIHGNVDMGRYAAEKLVTLTPDCTEAYVLLSNIYSVEGGWEERAATMKRMKEMGVKKETGVSWIELGKKFHSFVSEDDAHPQAERIYEVLDELTALTREDDLLCA